MPRTRRKKTSEIPTRIYSFRCLSPVTEAERVEEQFRLAHQFYNSLVEINHWMWESFRETWIADPRVGPAFLCYQDACANVDDALAELRAAKAGSADPDLSSQRERLSAAKELRAIRGDDLRAAKDHAKILDREAEVADADVGPVRLRYEALKIAKDASEAEKTLHKEQQKLLRAEWHGARRAAEADGRLPVDAFRVVHETVAKKKLAARAVYRERGLRTGTYDRIEVSFKQAEKTTAKGPVRFLSYDGTGSIGTQLIGGMTVSELLSQQDTRLRLGAPGAADPRPRFEVAGISWTDVAKLGRNVRRHAARTYVDLRVGSHPDRTPIFARFPVTLHRSLPEDAAIKWAYVVRKRVGRHYEWRFQVTIESASFRACSTAIGEGACAIDLGWRRLFDERGQQVGLRVGYLVDDTGLEREIRAPDDLIPRMDKVYDLASIRDKEFEGARARLVEWLRDRETPPWMKDRIESLGQWRAPRKLHSLVDAWTGIDWVAWRSARATGKKCNPSDFGSRENRAPGDGEILASLQAWARQDRHLQNWQEHQRDRLIAHRRETWRVLAAELTGRYATILIEGGTNRDGVGAGGGTMKITEIDGWERPEPEDGDPSDGREQRRMSRLAAPGELRVEILKASVKRGTRVEVEATAYSTQECAWCGEVEAFDAKPSIEHRCSSCARTWDQDANACRNLLHRHGLTSGPVPPSGDEVPVRKIA